MSSIILTILIASMATFAITRMKWKLNGVVLGLIMVGLMIPVHSSLIPLFKMFLEVNLIDHPLSIVLTYTAYNLPITVMILLGFTTHYLERLKKQPLWMAVLLIECFYCDSAFNNTCYYNDSNYKYDF